MYSNKKRVASVKYIPKQRYNRAYNAKNAQNKADGTEFYGHSSDISFNSLTRLRQGSWKDNNQPLDHVQTHLKKCKDTCNSVNMRLNSNDKRNTDTVSGFGKKNYKIATSGISK